jgi:hypothetical protein
MKLISVTDSTRKTKRYMATFRYEDGKEKKVHFGLGEKHETYIDHGSEKRRANYRARFSSATGYKPDTPMALSYYILWGDSKSLRRNIAAFKRKFSV